MAREMAAKTFLNIKNKKFMAEFRVEEIERVIRLSRGIEAYKKYDVAQKASSEEDFISERADIKRLVLQLHEKYYSRYLEGEKPKIEIIA